MIVKILEVIVIVSIVAGVLFGVLVAVLSVRGLSKTERVKPF